MLLYPFFSIMFLLLGGYNVVNSVRSIRGFIYLVILLPIGGVFTSFFIKSSIATFEFFYIGLSFSFLLRAMKNKIIDLPLIFLSLIIPSFYVLGVLNESPTEFILKDIKPFVVLLFAIMLIQLIKSNPYILRLSDIKILLGLNLVKVIIIFILGNYFGLNALLNDDKYFIQNENFRYSDIGTVFVALYFIYKLTFKNKMTIYDAICIFIPVLVTQQRTLLFTLLIILYVFYLFNAKFIPRIAMAITIPVCMIALFYLLGGRFFDVFNTELLSKLLSIRFSPFANELVNFKTNNDFIFGLGFGKPFHIPWFEYRENINNLNPNIDNLYLTYFMKFGISFVFVLLLFYHLLKKYVQHLKYFRYLTIYLLMLGVTTAFSYQSIFLFLYVFPVVFTQLNMLQFVRFSVVKK